MTLLNTDGQRLHALFVRLTLREDVAEDLFQDLTLRLAGSTKFAHADQSYAFARTAAMNLALDWRRRTTRRRRREAERATQDTSPAASPLIALARAELIDRVLDELQGLSRRDRLLITMRHLESMDYDHIGETIGKTAHQTRGLCAAALGRLRYRLGGVLDDEDQLFFADAGGAS